MSETRTTDLFSDSELPLALLERFRKENPEARLLAIYRVEDNGIGIDERYRDRLFRLFERLQGGEQYPGTGMGLAIAYAVALSLPAVGHWVAPALWGGEFPGAHVFESRLYILHVLVVPLLLATLIAGKRA